MPLIEGEESMPKLDAASAAMILRLREAAAAAILPLFTEAAAAAILL